MQNNENEEPANKERKQEEKESQEKEGGCPKCKNTVTRDLRECQKCGTIWTYDSTDEDSEVKLKNYSLGQILLKQREYLFDSIYKNERLLSKIVYCIIYSSLFFMIYGGVVGSYKNVHHGLMMALKVPLVFFGILLISGPVLFTFNIFMGTRLNFKQIFTMLLVSTYLVSFVLFSFSPIMLLFVLYSESLSFILILNLFSIFVAGGVGIALLWKAMGYFTAKNCYESNWIILSIWCAIYVFVGMQIAWSFEIFGDLTQLPIFKQLGIEENFYMAIFQLIKSFIGPGGD